MMKLEIAATTPCRASNPGQLSSKTAVFVASNPSSGAIGDYRILDLGRNAPLPHPLQLCQFRSEVGHESLRAGIETFRLLAFSLRVRPGEPHHPGGGAHHEEPGWTQCPRQYRTRSAGGCAEPGEA